MSAFCPGGTAYQTDVGMSGPYDSVIGVEKELVLHRFLTGMPGKFEAAKGNPKMCAALITCDAGNGARIGDSADHAWGVMRAGSLLWLRQTRLVKKATADSSAPVGRSE